MKWDWPVDYHCDCEQQYNLDDGDFEESIYRVLVVYVVYVVYLAYRIVKWSKDEWSKNRCRDNVTCWPFPENSTERQQSNEHH